MLDKIENILNNFGEDLNLNMLTQKYVCIKSLLVIQHLIYPTFNSKHKYLACSPIIRIENSRAGKLFLPHVLSYYLLPISIMPTCNLCVCNTLDMCVGGWLFFKPYESKKLFVGLFFKSKRKKSLHYKNIVYFFNLA